MIIQKKHSSPSSLLVGQEMKEICVAKIESSVKSHHCSNRKFRAGKVLKCIREPEKKQNRHTTSLNKTHEEQKEESPKNERQEEWLS